MSIRIITGFDGSSPHSDAGVEQAAPNKFTVYPSWRKAPGIDEEAPGAGSRFYIKIQNDSDKPLEVIISADWETPQRIEHHDYGYFCHEGEDEWTQIAGTNNGETKIDYQLEVKPGITEFGLLPAYNVGKLGRFLEEIKDKGIAVEVIGKSAEGRDINLISLPSENKNALNFFIQARDHAYETSGSYCVEAIVDFLHEKSNLSELLRFNYNFYILPMTNPDGVYNGMSRLTYEAGLNLDRLWWNNGPGKEGSILVETLDRLRPSVYMNMHNYAMKFVDGLLTSESMDFVEQIFKQLPADHEHQKEWFVMTDEEWRIKNNKRAYTKEFWGGKNYCKNQFGSLSVIYELTWFNRNTAQMKERGVRALTALALTAMGGPDS
ncbi:MAG: M14 family zinc carboxypeptidase [Planctomycetota bacterium]|jgi:hypothetical protein